MARIKLKLILHYLIWFLSIFYTLATIGFFLNLKDIFVSITDIVFFATAWPFYVGSFLILVIFYLLLIALPIISIIVHRKKHLWLNIYLLGVIMANLLLFIYSLSGLALI